MNANQARLNGASNERAGAGPRRSVGNARGWCNLVLAFGLLWLLAQVVLPWGQTLPGLKPVMTAISEAEVDVGTYWYSQSEKTAEAEIHVRNAQRR